MQNAPATPPPTANPLRMLVPPEEKFWKRYSPHHEAPLSGVSSFAIHLLAIPLLLLVAWVASKVRDEDENRSLPVDVVRVNFPGGGGSPEGAGKGPGGIDAPDKESGPSTEEKRPDRNPAADDPPKAPPVAKQKGITSEFNNDLHIKRLFVRGTEASARLFDLDRDVREKLRQNLNPGLGQGGGGEGGGRDTGKDKGTGPGEGAGRATSNERERRQLRWAMTFNTQNGIDYRNQLDGLGAIVAIPLDSGQFVVFRNLKNPREAKVEDITKFNRIYWVDDKPESVRSLVTALELTAVPRFFAAFFPRELEQKLLDRELAYLREHYGKTKEHENEIHETKFDVLRNGSGYDVRVSRMTLRH